MLTVSHQCETIQLDVAAKRYALHKKSDWRRVGEGVVEGEGEGAAGVCPAVRKEHHSQASFSNPMSY